MTASFILILILTFAFGYLNGVNGAGSVIATVISSRALRPNAALALAIACMCIGPFVFGIAVAGTIGADLINLSAVTTPVVIAALAGAVSWIGLATALRIPCSPTQAFIGSLLGAAWAGFGVQAIVAPGVVKTLLALFLSPILGIVVGYAIVKACRQLGTLVPPSVNGWFKGGQVVLSTLVAISFGSNDGQKLMGIVALGMMATTQAEFAIPAWSGVFAALAMAAGTLVGSSRVVRTLGSRLYSVEPIHGFGAQTASFVVLLSSSLLGSPISGSQVIASAIVGAGSAERVHKVRWSIFRQILNAWVLTLPISALAGVILYEILTRISL